MYWDAHRLSVAREIQASLPAYGDASNLLAHSVRKCHIFAPGRAGTWSRHWGER